MSTTATKTDKEEVLELLQRLPDDVPFHQIQHEVQALEASRLPEEERGNPRPYTREEARERTKRMDSALTRADVVAMLHRLPEGLTFADIHYHLFVLAEIELGLASMATEPTLSQAEAEAEFNRWFGK